MKFSDKKAVGCLQPITLGGTRIYTSYRTLQYRRCCSGCIAVMSYGNQASYMFTLGPIKNHSPKVLDSVLEQEDKAVSAQKSVNLAKCRQIWKLK